MSYHFTIVGREILVIVRFLDTIGMKDRGDRDEG